MCLNYLRFFQDNLRTDTYRGLHEGLIGQDGDAAQTGRRVILPSKFTGGARYFHEQAADALTYVTKFDPTYISWLGSLQIQESDQTTSISSFQRRFQIQTKNQNCIDWCWHT